MAASMDEYRFSHPLRVRWAECDPQGIVFFGHYVMYADIGMAEYFRALGLTYPDDLTEPGTDVFVKATRTTHHGSAVYDDELDIAVRTDRVGNSSLTLLCDIQRDGESLAEVELVYVYADLEGRRPVTVPAFVREAIEDFEGETA